MISNDQFRKKQPELAVKFWAVPYLAIVYLIRLAC